MLFNFLVAVRLPMGDLFTRRSLHQDLFTVLRNAGSLASGPVKVQDWRCERAEGTEWLISDQAIVYFQSLNRRKNVYFIFKNFTA